MNRRHAFPALALGVAFSTVACTREEIEPWGKLLFGFMIVALVVIPVVFTVAWRRRTR